MSEIKIRAGYVTIAELESPAEGLVALTGLQFMQLPAHDRAKLELVGVGPINRDIVLYTCPKGWSFVDPA